MLGGRFKDLSRVRVPSPLGLRAAFIFGLRFPPQVALQPLKLGLKAKFSRFSFLYSRPRSPNTRRRSSCNRMPRLFARDPREKMSPTWVQNPGLVGLEA